MTYTYHPRSTWVDPARPVTGPALPWATIDTIAPHYTAAVDLIDGDLGEFVEDLPAYFRAIQRDYLLNRPTYRDGVLISTGYSIGYNFGIDWLGGVWQLRGWDIKCAANAGNNDHVVAVLFLVDGADHPTPEAWSAFRDLNREARQRAERKLKVIDHGRLPNAATACAGAGIRADVDAGLGDDEYAPPTPPTPELPPTGQPTTNEGESMFTGFYQNKASGAIFAAYSGGYKTWIPDVATFNVMTYLAGAAGKPTKLTVLTDAAVVRALGPIVGP